MRVTFLGTSAGTPTRERNVTSQAIQFDDGRIWLLDCGEATQHQLMRAGLKPGRIERVLITHLHGDHCFGLPGLLACCAIHTRPDQQIEIIGPPGVREFIEVTLRISAMNLPYPLEVREISVVGEIGVRGDWSISTWPLTHRVACFGYVLREHDLPGRFHPERAQALGIVEGRDFGRLKRGESVASTDGRVVQANEVCEPRRRGRKLVLLGDTCDSTAILGAGRGCDVLIHEATYDGKFEDKAREWGHSTSLMAGRFAALIEARTLILTHFSSRYGDGDSGPTIADLVLEAQSECPATTVHAASDLWCHEIPRPE